MLVPDFRKANYEKLRRHLEEVYWESLGLGNDSQESSVERTFNNLVQAIGKGQAHHIPYSLLRKDNNDPEWMSCGLKHETGVKWDTYKRIETGETYIRTRYYVSLIDQLCLR